MTDERWPGEWMRGVLSLCVLRFVADGPTYGYAIAARLGVALLVGLPLLALVGMVAGGLLTR